jgi:hypothetical protein
MRLLTTYKIGHLKFRGNTNINRKLDIFYPQIKLFLEVRDYNKSKKISFTLIDI